MEIKTNTANKLAKIMNGDSFGDKFTFISECLQNCQRSNAKNVCINYAGNELSIADDGCGCRNPEVVLTLDSSEWKSTNEGFGIGFMSVFAIPKLERVVIESFNWRIDLDVQAIREGNLDYIVKPADKISGFKVIIYSEYFKEHEYELSERLVVDSQYINKFATYVNGNLIETKSILNNYQVSGFAIHVNCADYEGILEISTWGGIKVYYENRFVCESYNLANGVAGVIDGRVVYRKNIRDGVYGLTDHSNGSVYLDRCMLNLKEFRIKKGRFSVKEYRCLMNAMDTISHELSHLLYNTQDNTLDHYKIQAMLQTEILKLY